MSLTLTPEQEAALEQTVRAGRYASPEEALAAAIDDLLDHVPGSPAMTARLAKVRTKNLVDLFRDSPFVNSGIDLDADKAPWREVNFD